MWAGGGGGEGGGFIFKCGDGDISFDGRWLKDHRMGCALPCLVHYGKRWHRVLLFLHIYHVPKDKTMTWLIQIKQHNYSLLLFIADNWAICLNKLLIFYPFKFSFLLPLFNHIFCHSLVTQNSLVILTVSLLVASIMAFKN